MELDNVDVLLGMTIAAIILGIGVSMFFIYPFTGYGAVVLAIGMMTFALMITARPRVIERVKREIVLQPSKQAEPSSVTPPTFVIPQHEPPPSPPEPFPMPTQNQTEHSPTTEDEQVSSATSTPESTPLQEAEPDEKAPESHQQSEEELVPIPPT